MLIHRSIIANCPGLKCILLYYVRDVKYPPLYNIVFTCCIFSSNRIHNNKIFPYIAAPLFLHIKTKEIKYES